MQINISIPYQTPTPDILHFYYISITLLPRWHDRYIPRYQSAFVGHARSLCVPFSLSSLPSPFLILPIILSISFSYTHYGETRRETGCSPKHKPKTSPRPFSPWPKRGNLNLTGPEAFGSTSGFFTVYSWVTCAVSLCSLVKPNYPIQNNGLVCLSQNCIYISGDSCVSLSMPAEIVVVTQLELSRRKHMKKIKSFCVFL